MTVISIKLTRTAIFTWIYSCLLALQTFLGILQLFDAVNIVHYPMIHRATGTRYFDLGFNLVIPLAALLFLWVVWIFLNKRFKVILFPALILVAFSFISIEMSISVASLIAVFIGLWLFREFSNFFQVFFYILGFFEFLALLHWLIFLPFDLFSPFTKIAKIEIGLFYIAAHLAPILVLFFLYMWIIKLLLHWHPKKEYYTRFLKGKNTKSSLQKGSLILFFSILLSIIAAIYPFLTSVNPRNEIVGVDYEAYVETARVVENNFSKAFSVANGTRPIIFLLIYGVQNALNLSVGNTVKFLPIFLNPLLALSIYFLSYEAFRDHFTAGLSSFFTICGTQVIVGMFGFYLSNMFALSMVFISLGFLFKSVNDNCNINLIFASIFGIFLSFTHPWTFNQYFLPIVLTSLFIFYNSITKTKDFKQIKILFIYLLILIILEIIKGLFFSSSGIFSTSTIIIEEISKLSKFWSNIVFSLRRYWGGLLSITITLFLSILSIYLLSNNKIPENYLNIFLIVTSVIYFFGNARIKSRMFYNIPIGLFASHGFINIIRNEKFNNFKNALFFYVFISLIVYLFRSLANLI